MQRYRFEFLLFSLAMVLFNKIFFSSSDFFTKYIWSGNIIMLAVACMSIFREQHYLLKATKNILFCVAVAVPVFASVVFGSPLLTLMALCAYALFYSFIFYEVLRQITRKSQVTEGIIFGSVSGFLLLTIIATFTFLIQHFFHQQAFNGVGAGSVPDVYYRLSYFALITLTTIGFGDIAPATDSARLLTAFWGVVRQFYMVGIVGIIVSKFSSR